MDERQYKMLRAKQAELFKTWQTAVRLGNESYASDPKVLKELRDLASKLEEYDEAHNRIPRD